MTVVFMTNPATGHCALYDEAPGGGDPTDTGSLRNRPLISPNSWLANIYFHTALDNLEVFSSTSLLVNHALVAGTASTTVGGSNTAFGESSGNKQTGVTYGFTTTYVLTTHNLGYIPDFLCIVDGQAVFAGKIIQNNADGRARYITAYATTTQIILHQWCSVSASDLAALSKTYSTIVFRQQRSISGNNLIDFDPSTGIVEMGRNRFKSDRRYLQVVPGGSPFAIAYGKTLDLKRGSIRVVNPDGTFLEPISPSQSSRFVVRYRNHGDWAFYTPAFGATMGYDGTFTGPTQIMVQAP